MEAWAAARRMRTSLHWMTPMQADFRRTGVEVPVGVLGG